MTIADVAREAEVSVGTVSDILNRGQERRYSEPTRQRVLAVVKAMRYTPNSRAQKLALRRTRDIGFLFTRPFDYPFFGKMAAIISRVLHAEKYHLEIANEPFWLGEDHEPLQRLIASGVDGLIIGPQYGKKEADALASMALPDIPILVFGRHPAGSCDVIHGNLVETGRIMGRNLKQHGHRRVAFFGVEESDAPYLENNPKLDGLMQAMGGEDSVAPEWRTPQPADETVEDLYPCAHDAARRWQDSPPAERPTAFCCQNDGMAMVLIGAFRELGIDVPADLSVVGCDNAYASAFFFPPLTTVDQREAEMVDRGMRQLLGRLDGTAEPWGEVVSLPPRLIERKSVASAPS